MIWITFIALAGALIFFGSRLTIYADQLADDWKLTRSWVGLLMVGFVTSLPEIATTVSSVAAVGSPNLATGNVLGSVLFNLTILALCDFAFRKGGFLKEASSSHILSAVLGVLLMAALLVGLLFPMRGHVGVWHFGWGSVLVFALCIGSFYLLYRSEQGGAGPEPAELKQKHTTHAGWKFLAASMGVVVCGYALAGTGDKLAELTGLSRSFIGSLFLAFATSLPELIVSITAIRIGAYDLMLGNILGSNLLNVAIVSLADFSYPRAALNIPDNLGLNQVFVGLVGILATCVVIVALSYKPVQKSKRRRVGMESYVLLGLYVLAMSALFFGWIG